MISDREIDDWNPKPGDRVEVVMSEGWTLARGVLVAIYQGARPNDFQRGKDGPNYVSTHFIHCDKQAFGAGEWTAAYRADQVRKEWTPADHLEIAIHRLSKEPERSGWFQRRDRLRERQRELDVNSTRAVAALIRHHMPVVNVSDQIILETPEGLRQGDPVNIHVLEGGGKGVFPGIFVAEFKGIRHVIYNSGSSAAYPKDQVTKI